MMQDSHFGEYFPNKCCGISYRSRVSFLNRLRKIYKNRGGWVLINKAGAVMFFAKFIFESTLAICNNCAGIIKIKWLGGNERENTTEAIP